MPTKAIDLQLTTVQARKIVSHAVDCAHRAGVERFELAASRPIDGFARQYDTLVFELKLQPSHQQQQLRSEQQLHRTTTPGAALLRETLLLLHAVTNCRGFSFQENPAFWKQALSLELSPAVPITSQRLPRVALDWNPQDLMALPEYDKAMGQRLLETSILDLFTTKSPPPLSKKGQTLLADAGSRSQQRSHEDDATIECVVVIRYARVADTPKAIVKAVSSAAKTAVSSPSNDSLRWVGVRLVSSDHVKYVNHGLLTVANLTIVAQLCP